MDKIKLIGLTGVSGSGKTTVANMLKNRGFAVINCDKVSRDVTNKGEPCLLELCKAFGSDILAPDGTLDRKKLGARAFSSRESTDLLNSITHPFITERILSIIDSYEHDGYRAVILDAPTLFESGINKMCDAVILVTSDRATALSRIIERDGLDESSAKIRHSRALSDEFFLSHCDCIIHNDHGIKELEKAVDDTVSELESKLF